MRLLHPSVTPLRNVTKRVPMTDAIVVDVANEDCQEHNVLERFSGVWNLGHIQATWPQDALSRSRTASLISASRSPGGKRSGSTGAPVRRATDSTVI